MLPTDQSQSQSCIMNYTHLTQKERYQIFTLLREGFSKRYIARRLNHSPSTISREITRNRTTNSYFAKHANKLARGRHCPNPKEFLMIFGYESLLVLISNGVPNRWLPHMSVSLHSIYRFIQQDKIRGGVLFHNLGVSNQRKRKYGSIETREQLTKRKSIHDRPVEIEQRSRFGNLEIDMIVGKNHQQSLVSILDRKTGYLWLKKCSNPYSVWQRRTNENIMA